MKIFISWSGEASRQIAEALREWLPQVIQAVEPWLSSQDLSKGTRWSPEVARQLEDSKVGILCVTPENVAAPWLLFEAGALAKSVEDSFVIPYLFRLKPTDVTGPLTQFQAATAEQDETRLLVQTVNSALGDKALATDKLSSAFEKWWPDLRESLTNVVDVPAHTRRTQVDLLEELVDRSRNQERKLQALILLLRNRYAASEPPEGLKIKAIVTEPETPVNMDERLAELLSIARQQPLAKRQE